MVTLNIKSVLSSFLKKVELIDPKLKTKFFSLFIDAGGMPDVLCPCFKLAIISSSVNSLPTVCYVHQPSSNKSINISRANNDRG